MAKRSHARDLQHSVLVELFFALLAIASAVLLVYEVSTPLSPTELRLITWFDLVTVVLFLLDFLVGIYQSKQRWHYLQENWIYLVAAVPFTSGALRAFRLFRLFRLVNLIYIASEQRTARYRPLALMLRSYANLATFSVVSIMAGSIAFYSVEHVSNPRIETYWDAVWWAFVCATSVGYGDVVPTTTEGRVVAILLMVVGVGIVGTIAGLVARYTLGQRLPNK